MKKHLLLLAFLFVLMISGQAQVAVNETGNDPDESAMLDVASTAKGILIPRMNTLQRTGIQLPANGLLVYDTNFSSFWYYNQPKGYWIELAGNLALYLNDLEDAQSNVKSLFLGDQSGQNDQGIYWNVGVGPQALKTNLDGENNTALGFASLAKNESGNENTSVGAGALASNTTGNTNVANGFTALGVNRTGSDNVALGNRSLLMLNSGSQNTAVGSGAGQNVSGTASGNVFLGYNAGKEEDGSNKLYIENSDSSAPLIGGDFATDKVDVNADLKVAKELLVMQDVTANTNMKINIDLAVGRNLEVAKRLTVADSLIVSNALQIAGGTDGKVLTSDADGNASWQEAPIGGASELNELSDAKTTPTGIHLGSLAGNTMTGNYNITLGQSAMQNNSEGYNNIAIGVLAGFSQNTISTSGNIIIGNRVGIDNELDNQLIIDNGESESPLIQGDFSTKSLKINGTLSITGGNPAEGKVLTSDVDGNASWEEVPVNVSSLNDLSDAKNDDSSLFLGSNPGSDDGQNKNTAVGLSALTRNSSGQNNVAFGHSSLLSNTTGTENTAFGSNSMELNTTGNQNTAVGSAALYNVGSGSNNTALGFEAGFGSFGSNASGNVFIGNKAGYNETESNKLYIDNSETESPLIYGDFEENQAKINGGLTVQGQIQANDDIVLADGKNITFENARTAKLQIPGCDFKLNFLSEMTILFYEVGFLQIWVREPQIIEAYAPIKLPKNAVIKGYTNSVFYLFGGNDYKVSLVKRKIDEFDMVNLDAQEASILVENTIEKVQSNSFEPITIEDDYVYFIHVSVLMDPPDPYSYVFGIAGVTIDYEYQSLNQ
ncbi:MAG: hypothetical protein JW729_06840 [Bacteroidales bacterium]|nr:hypothetical protein [Bacteroidales bacterium]